VDHSRSLAYRGILPDIVPIAAHYCCQAVSDREV
jgi:hypothetical protein